MGRWKKRPTADHAASADRCRRRPGAWVEIGTYNGGGSALRTARFIRLADRLPCYAPAGSFETRVRSCDEGAVVYARYLGPAR
uniref:hypothetical protein n=1 Tax=Streptomyces sp. CA-141956 TaxID=3240051 RepID=UPI003F497A9E